MLLKEKLKQHMLPQMVYRAYRGIIDGYHITKRIQNGKRAELDGKYHFIDRSHGYEKLCIILSGYKEPVWDDVFPRIKSVLSNDIDVCVMTSGMTNDRLIKLCETYSWSYLSTERNQLGLIQNIAIDLHKNAKWIYKVDEDMFLTKGFFEKLLETYLTVARDTSYCPAFVSPLINVNGYSYIRILEKCGLSEDYKSKFGEMKYSEGLHHHKETIENADFARYMWGQSQSILRDIDALTEQFSKDKLTYSICPIRFSIGALLFSRESWTEFNMFPVDAGNGLGADEERICYYAMFTGRVIIVNENIVAGHLGYGPQSKAMIEYYQEHRESFHLKD